MYGSKAAPVRFTIGDNEVGLMFVTTPVEGLMVAKNISLLGVFFRAKP